MIKICYVIGTLEIGGAERQLLQLVKNLDKQRFLPVLLTLRDGRMRKDFEEAVKVRVVGKRWKFDPLFLLELTKIIKQEKPDILHTFMFTSNTWGRIAGIITGVPVIVASERSMDSWKKWYHFLIDKILGFFTKKIVCNSEEVKNLCVSKLKLRDQKFTVIINGIDLDFYEETSVKLEIKKEFGIEEGERIVLSGGRLSWEKGLEYLVYSAKRVINEFPAVKFLIAGEGPEKEKLKKLVEKLLLKNKVVFTGYRKDLPFIIKTSDIVVLSSLWEGMPNLLLEAMALGKPIVATNVGGCKEIIKDGKNGFLVEVKDVENLAERILVLLKNQTLCTKMGERGFEIVKSNFALSKMIGKYERIYLRMLL